MTPYKSAFTPSVATIGFNLILVTNNPFIKPVISAAANAATTAPINLSSFRSGPQVTITTVSETAPATEAPAAEEPKAEEKPKKAAKKKKAETGEVATAEGEEKPAKKTARKKKTEE